MEPIFAISALLGVVVTASGGTFWLGRLNGRVSEVDRINNERHERVGKSLERIEKKLDSLISAHGGSDGGS